MKIKLSGILLPDDGITTYEMDEHIDFELRTAIILCAALWTDCERKNATIKNILINCSNLIARVFGKCELDFIYMEYKELRESLRYLITLGFLSKSNKGFLVNPDFKLWFLDTYAGIGSLANGNTNRLKEIFHSVQTYIIDIESSKGRQESTL